MDKNVLETKFDNGEWGKTTQGEKFILEMFYGLHVGKNDPSESPNLWTYSPIDCATPKMKFPNRMKEETTENHPGDISAIEY